MQTAACLRMLDELREAVDVYECSKWGQHPVRPLTNNSTVRLLDQTNNDVKMKLAEIYEILNEPRKALELVYEGDIRFVFCQ
jgi:general transcription factor 3C polypeptide 3 (transcription factor C subunit 4)